MKMPIFRSSLAQGMTDLVTFKRAEGHDYTAQAVFLKHFDSFLDKQGYQKTSLDRKTVDDYIAHIANQADNTRYSRLSTVRVLSRYLHQFDPESYVLRELPVQRPAQPRWYLLTPEETEALLQRAKSLGPPDSLRPHCYYMLVGLLCATGLRISEALALNLGDLDKSRQLLLVHKGKFGKERYVVLHPSAIAAMEAYLAKRAAYAPSGDSSAFFLNTSGTRLGYKQVSATFRRMVRHCGIAEGTAQKPRLHDLRHTYASRCLLKWYEEGCDVNSKLPILTTALGHVNVRATQIYIHVTSRLLAKAAHRFRDTFSAICQGKANTEERGA
jgi:site-specific recombinase XerD